MADKEELIQQLASKYHVPPSKIRKAVESQFQFVSKNMRKETLPSIRLPFFGVFKADPNRIKHLNNAKRKQTIRKDTSKEKEES